mmetsp:Transcript_20419/g.36650  ORF Transcript_20419/g.36650 Transcript_20419/m.36650 type:complete len:87 (+) Transcript_20419:119-379(+)
MEGENPPIQDIQPWKAIDTVYTNEKAGMDSVDKDLIKRVIYEASKDSNFFKKDEEKRKQTNERIARLKEKLAKVTEDEMKRYHAVE